MPTTCTACNACPTPQNAYLCTNCQHQLRHHLATTPNWLTELTTETTKQTRKTTGPHSHTPPGTNTPLPYNAAAAAIKTDLEDLLTGTATLLGEPSQRPGQAAASLWIHTHKLAAHPTAPWFLGQLATLLNQAQHLCDNPPDKHHYLGVCIQCQQPMRTPKTQGLYHCQCGTTWDIHECLRYQHERLHDPDASYTLAELATLTGKTNEALKMRVNRHNIQPTAGKGRGAYYRYGDLISDTERARLLPVNQPA